MTMSIAELSPKEAQAFLKSHPDAKLIDVRTDEEFAVARIPGAILVNTSEKADEILQWPKETPIIVQCHHGVRSLSAAHWLQQKGFTQVFNLAGGIDAWTEDVDPTIRRY